MKKTVKPDLKIPTHVAIIMDGNRRWAALHGLGAVDGHRVAAEKTIEPLVDKAKEMGVKYLTFWAFSTENWSREKYEVKGLMNIFREALKSGFLRLIRSGVQIRVLGDIERFPIDIARRIRDVVKATSQNKEITVSFALNYGGRDEILRAVKKLYDSIKVKKISIESISEEDFRECLDTQGIPDPDFVIRTGGAQRLSGYLPWQSVYAELYFTEIYFPDFSPREFEKAIQEFTARERRFGGGSFKDYLKMVKKSQKQQLAPKLSQ